MTEVFRELETKQKSITMYKDQADKLNLILKQNPRAFQPIMRRAIDMIIKELEKEGRL